MWLDIRAAGVQLDRDTRDLITRRLEFALARLGGAVRWGIVYVRDENGPRGGADQTLRVVLEIRGVGTRVVQGRGDDLTDLIDRVAGRAGRVVREELGRRRTAARA